MDYVLGIIDACGDEHDKFMSAKASAGQCYITTHKVGALIGWNEIEMIYAENLNNPDGRFYELNQYSNHYAIYVPEEGLVLDYTLRQFNAATPFPYVGTVDAWTLVLAEAWEYKNVSPVTGLLCMDCEHVGKLCNCCGDCGPRHDCNCDEYLD